MKVPSHVQRWLTALILLPLLAGAIFRGGWFVFAAAGIVTSLGIWEFYTLFWPGRQKAFLKFIGAGTAMGLLLAAELGRPGLMPILILAAFWLANLKFLAAYGREPEKAAYRTELILVAGLLYLALPLQLFFLFTPLEIVLVLAAAFASDTGAFYAGTFLGGKKIWPRVSPKKTWAGSIGGLLCSMGVCLLIGALWSENPWWVWPLLGAGLNVAAQFGDFFESALKRHLDVKDSGSLLPGHGGILDRVDSLLLVAPVYAGLDAVFGFFG